MASTPKKPTSPCGGCTVCCRVLEVEEIPGGPKPANTPCRWLHTDESGYRGCSIYKDRPLPCQKFECHYIKLARRPDLTTSPDFRPDKCGVMFVHHPTRIYFIAHVWDPKRRYAWRNPEPIEVIRTLLAERFKVIVTWGVGDKLLLEDDGFGGITESTIKEDPTDGHERTMAS